MHAVLPVLSLLAATATAKSTAKRDVTVNWGPIVGFYETSSEIISTISTIYPGKMPSDQKGYMFAWIGIGNTTGDLVQSIVGSYPAGLSECEGDASSSTAWCISSEVYGASTGVQSVGQLTTADADYENGIVFNYTLIDKATYLWEQTMTDAVTGKLLSTFQKATGPATLWNTAVELQPYNGASPTGLVEPQYYVNTTIVLAEEDASYGSSMYVEYGGEHTDATTSDGGKTVCFSLLLSLSVQSHLLTLLIALGFCSGSSRRLPLQRWSES